VKRNLVPALQRARSEDAPLTTPQPAAPIHEPR
jgi:hypothetical protein